MKPIALIRLLRPSQWVKNLFCFLPLFFNGDLGNWQLLLYTLLTCGSFCLISSSIYCLNDLRDAEVDRLHPTKCNRPVASGSVSVPAVIIIMALLVVGAGGMAYCLPDGSQRYGLLAIIGVYFVINLAYCFKLKQIPIVDVTVISFGFVLRVLAGGVATGIFITHWIVIMTFLLALFLALCKRRDDVVIYENTGVAMRKNINHYNVSFMNQSISIVATVTLVAYIMYTVSADVMERFHSTYLYITSLFVLLGILRFLQIALVDDRGSGSPTKVVLHDRFVQIAVVGWILTFAILIYF